jgi:acetyltransferase-like isoleucine patch superfamily enzyme
MNWKQRRIEQVELFENRRIWSSPDIESAKVIIEDDAWIGLKTTILKGVRIGRGAVVGANSVVTKDAPPFTLVAGNPARVVRQLPN